MTIAVLVAFAAACSSDAKPKAGAASSTVSSAATERALARPSGPAADISEELTAGNGPFMGAATGAHLSDADFVEHEFVASGTASSYAAKGDQTVDGTWTFETNGSAAFRTRVLVRRPPNGAKFNGTVVVEWLNVSGGVDANPEYADLEEELLRSGDAWVGVSAQLIGVEGGTVLVTAPAGEGLVGKGLKGIDAARYSSLAHPGDGFSFDIFTQVARALRNGTPAMGDLKPERLLAAGDSQSAFALTTYYDGVQPLTKAFDGFLVHSRAAFGLPLAAPGQPADLAAAFGAAPPLFRGDVDAPVLDVQSESDVVGLLNSVKARQPDSDHFRLWEVAGTAHADKHLLGPTADALDCGAPVNAGPMHVVLKAALRQLDGWVRTGTAAPEAPRLELAGGDSPQVGRDADGIALGGVRTPPVDFPVDELSGTPGSNPSLLCALLGSTTPLSPARLAQLYPSRDAYVQRYNAATDAAIDAGFVLREDRDALIAFADPSRISS